MENVIKKARPKPDPYPGAGFNLEQLIPSISGSDTVKFIANTTISFLFMTVIINPIRALTAAAKEMFVTRFIYNRHKDIIQTGHESLRRLSVYNIDKEEKGMFGTMCPCLISKEDPDALLPFIASQDYLIREEWELRAAYKEVGIPYLSYSHKLIRRESRGYHSAGME